MEMQLWSVLKQELSRLLGVPERATVTVTDEGSWGQELNILLQAAKREFGW